MKKILFLLTICLCLSSCNKGDIERLEKENESLKAQIAELRQNQQNQIGNSPIKTTPQTNTGAIAKTQAQQVVKNYLLAETAKERSSFVLNPKEELPRMKKMYGESDMSWANRFFQFGEDRKSGDYVLVTVQMDGYSPILYALKQGGDKLKIDWTVSQFLHGKNPMPDTIKKMQLDMDHKKHILLAETYAILSHNGAFFDDRDHMHAFNLIDRPSRASGYCEKANPSCHKLFEKLKEYKGCIVSLEAWYPQKVFEYISVPDAWHRSFTGEQMEIGNIQIKLCW